MTPEHARMNVCVNCGGVLSEDGSCPGCGWSEQELPPRAHERHRYQYTGLLDEEPDWDDDRYDPSAQACQSVHQAGDFWSDYAGSVSMDEPQQEMYERGLEITETAESDVHRLVTLVEQRDKEQKATLDRILAQTSPPTLWQRIQENAMDYIITLVIGGIAVGLWLIFVGL